MIGERVGDPSVEFLPRECYSSTAEIYGPGERPRAYATVDGGARQAGNL